MFWQRLMWVAWPAFLMAGILDGLVFTLVDPQDLHWLGHPVMLSRLGVYTLGFLLFWCIITASGALTVLLSMSPFEVNRCPLAQDERPPVCPKQGLH